MKTIEILKKKHVAIQDVIMLEASQNYTVIHFWNGKTFILAKTLKQLQNSFFENGFFRINRSSIINLNYIAKTNNSYTNITLKNNLEFNVSRRRRDEFEMTLMNYKFPQDFTIFNCLSPN